MSRRFSIIVFILGLLKLSGQMPETDIWLFKLEKYKIKQSVLTKPLNITNRAGYDNQPSFSPDNKKIYYVSVREDKQADIYYYDLKTGKNIRLTKTMESEYSPNYTADGKFITSVVVETDSAQRIHFITPLTGVHEKKFEADSVGYYTFLNKDTVVFYKLTEPHSLRYFTTTSYDEHWLGNLPTRTFRALNRHTLLYGLKDSSKVIFYKYNFLIQKAEKYCEYNSLNEDVIWHATLGLIKSETTKLLRYNETKKEWELLYDLSAFGIKKITRFAFDTNNKYLVVVNNL